jgi:hypothetical protein
VVYGGSEIERAGWDVVQRELARRGFDVEVKLDGTRSLDVIARRRRFGRLLVNYETRASNGALELSAWPELAAAELATRDHSLFLQAIGEDDAVLELFGACAFVLAEQLDGLVYDESSATLTRADGSDAKVQRVVVPREGVELATIGIGTALLEWPHDLAPDQIERTLQEVAPPLRLLRIGKLEPRDPGFDRDRAAATWRYVDLGDPDGTKLSLELERRGRQVEIRIVVDDEPHAPALELARAVLERLAMRHAARLVGFEPD